MKPDWPEEGLPPVRLLSGLTRDFKIRSSLFPSVSIRAQADFNARQNRYMALDQTETRTPGYMLLNAGILTTIQYTKTCAAQFQIQISNLLNAAYQSNQSRLKYFEYYIASPTGRLGMFGMGRNICMRLIISF